jgi:hypothetical protein
MSETLRKRWREWKCHSIELQVGVGHALRVLDPAHAIGLAGSVRTPGGSGGGRHGHGAQCQSGGGRRYSLGLMAATGYQTSARACTSMQAGASKLGYVPQGEAAHSLGKTRPLVRDGVAQVDFTRERTDNVAAQVPASAWIHAMGESALRNDLVTCARNGTSSRTSRSRPSRPISANSRWRSASRSGAPCPDYAHAVLRGAAGGNANQPEPEAIAALTKPENSFINLEDENLLTPWLAAKFPTHFSHYPIVNAKTWTGPLGVNPRTGRLWIANSPIPSEKDPEVRWVFSLDPGDRTALSDAHAAR